jgi:hypothetical protein
MTTKSSTTIEALYRVPENGKAEIVGDDLVRMSPTGFLPGQAATAIAASLRAHQRRNGGGRAVGHKVGFVVDLPHRPQRGYRLMYNFKQLGLERVVDSCPSAALPKTLRPANGPRRKRPRSA